MGKLINDISNYPMPTGSTAFSNALLSNGSFKLKDEQLTHKLVQVLEFSKNINFFGPDTTASNRWYDLLKQSTVFQLARFQGINGQKILSFFQDLALSNGFTADATFTQAELETLAYQKLQILQYLFWFYKTVVQNIQDENASQVQSILKSDTVSALFLQYQGLLEECFKAPALIKSANSKGVKAFNEISFSVIDKSLTDSLIAFYNPNPPKPTTEVLNIYSNNFDKIKAANEHCYSIFKNILQIHQTFSFWSTAKIEQYAYIHDSHEPHIALLLAFVKLQLLFDERFNQLAYQQSTFIFQDILQLKKQSILPDKALINIELAKNINQYFVPKNTLFKAGKNAENKQIYYQSNADLVLNAAKIEQIASQVRIYKNNKLFTVSATTDAPNPEWQVNNAWLPFNDLSEAYTGLSFESKLLQLVSKKGTPITFEVNFNADLPGLPANLAEKLQITVIEQDGTEKILLIDSVAFSGNRQLTIITKIEEDLKTLKQDINARLKLISPAKTEQNNDYVELYQYLLSETIGNLKVKLNQSSFVPSNVKTTSGLIDGSTSFAAFGTTSQTGSSFSIAHPFLPFAKTVNIKLNWAEALKTQVDITAKGLPKTLTTGDNSPLNDFENDNGSEIAIRLTKDLTYKITSTVKSTGADRTIETNLPKILIIKDIALLADLEELVYQQETPLPKFIEYYRNYYGIIRSLRLGYADKTRQKERVIERIKQIRQRNSRPRHHNSLAHLYPLGELVVYKNNNLKLIPDDSLLDYNTYQAELCIGLSNIVPGQSLSLLFEIADETAEQTEREALITWHFVENNLFKAIEANKIIDSTANFLQSGLVQLSLPENANNQNTILFGQNLYWLVARCNTNYDVVANIKNIKINGLEICRVLDENNQEAKVSVAAGTIENIYPKTANIKTVSQNIASQLGREPETDAHYWWRSSQRLRHKKRAINQWDIEQMVLEQFSNIYKVKCFNHAYYDAASQQIVAKPAHTIVSLLPYYAGAGLGDNLQPALQLSKLLAIKNFILSKTSAFTQFQVLNTQWDEVRIEAEIVLANGLFDLLFYKEQLNTDLKHFLVPWAFESNVQITDIQPIYLATLVDFIDELSYVHHIRSLKIFKNDLEIQNEITASTALHLLSTVAEHSLIVKTYVN